MNDLAKYRPGGGLRPRALATAPEAAPGLAALVAESRQIKAELAPLSEASRAHRETLPELLSLADERGAALEADLADFTLLRGELSELSREVKGEKEELTRLTEVGQQTRRQLLQEVSAQIEAAEIARRRLFAFAPGTRPDSLRRAPGASVKEPGAVAAPPSARNSDGPTDFAFLYSQLGSLDTRLDRIDNGLTAGPMAIGLQDLANVNIFNPTNGQVLTYDSASGTWKNLAAAGGASLSASNTFTAPQTVCVNDTLQTAVTTVLDLCHETTLGTGGPLFGVGLRFLTETTGTEGQHDVLAQIDADAVAVGPGATKGRLNFRIETGGAGTVTPLQLYTAQVTIPQAPLAAATKALLQLGSGPFLFGGSPPAFVFNGSSLGTVLGINEVGGYSGNLLDAQVSGLSRFRISATADHRAQVYDAVNAAVTALSVVHRFTSGAPAAGFGVALDFVGDNDLNALATYAEINASATSTAAGSEQADLVFLCHSAERLRIVGATQDVNTSGQYQSVGGLLAGNTTGKGALVDIARPGTGSPAAGLITSLRVVSPGDTLAAGAEATDVYFNLFQTKAFSGAPGSLQRIVRIEAPILSSGTVSTVDKAATVYVGGSPSGAGSVTITSRYSLWCAGTVKVESGDASGVILELAGDLTAPTGSPAGRIKINVPGVGVRYLGYWLN